MFFYWEMIVFVLGLGGFDDVFIDGMLVGLIFSFLWNGFILMIFFVGFLFCYFLYIIYVVKNGVKVGLGI